MFVLKGISKKYKIKSGAGIDALTSVSLTLPDTGMVFICGRSGCGKTTLINMLGGLDKPDDGEIDYNGQKISSLDEKSLADYRNGTVGFVFQENNLLEYMNAESNIVLPLSLQKQVIDMDVVDAAIAKVGMTGYNYRRISELSGGQKQRIAIARAIVKNPDVILADEPTGNLDSKTGREILLLLKELSRTRLVVVVTHDREKATEFGDYHIEMRDGKIISTNCPQESNDFTLQASQQNIKKAYIPFRVSAKMGAENLLRKPVRLASLLVAMIITVYCLVTAQIIYFYEGLRAALVIIIIAGIMLFTTIVLVMNMIGVGITDRTKELGVLKALGARNRNLFTLFFTESLILSLVGFIMSIGTALLSILRMNIVYERQMAAGDLFFADYKIFLTVFAVSFPAVFLATLLPLLRIRKLNPIEAIRAEK